MAAEVPQQDCQSQAAEPVYAFDLVAGDGLEVGNEMTGRLE